MTHKNKVSVPLSSGPFICHVEADLYKDGDQWCCGIGENLQEGIHGFGYNPVAATQAFMQQLYEVED